MFVVVPHRSDAMQEVSDMTGSGAIRCKGYFIIIIIIQRTITYKILSKKRNKIKRKIKKIERQLQQTKQLPGAGPDYPMGMGPGAHAHLGPKRGEGKKK